MLKEFSYHKSIVSWSNLKIFVKVKNYCKSKISEFCFHM
jgi:hypothetical protein